MLCSFDERESITMSLSKLQHAAFGYAGILPFLALLLLFAVSQQLWAIQLFVFYSLAIINFVAGTVWQPNKAISKLQHIALLPSLIIPISLLLSTSLTLALLIVGYVALLRFQMLDEHWEPLPKSYQNMRLWVTGIVVSLHLLAIILFTMSG